MIDVKTAVEYKKFIKWCHKLDENSKSARKILEAYGARGVELLKANTPVDTGATAAAWDYVVTWEDGNATITWTNTHAPYGVPVAILLFYGHGTRYGGYVEGIDYINPALKPLFEQMKNDIVKEVLK